jgi:serine-type D-Ala-D-Ala carboxypeptidase (penicillin-binding protein 5/6)
MKLVISPKKITGVVLVALILVCGDRIFAASSQAGVSSPGVSSPGVSSPGIERRPPAVGARAVAIIDEATGTLLYAKNPDLVIPPASLTKLVTLHVVYQEIEAGRLKEDELVTIDKRDCSPYIPYGSTLMYLRPGMRVSIIDLMRGAAVVSGNDAAFALARRVSGSNEAFAERMNQAVKELGLPELYFVEPSGLSEKNRVTARGYAEFCRLYVRLHPQAIAELHSLHYIEFPRPEHATADYQPKGRMIQYNKNNLVLKYPGCDGLKTGYIIESGYNLAATAKRGDTRFIIVTLGGTGEGSRLGGSGQRSQDGSALLDWAFTSFVTVKPSLGALPRPRAWYGAESRLVLKGADELAVTLPRSIAGTVETRIEVPASVDAPIAKGSSVGEVVYSADGKVLRRVELVAANAVQKGNLLVVVRDAFARFFTRLFGSA